MAAHNLVSTFVLGFLPPTGIQLLVEDEVVGLHSSERVEVTLVAYYSARCLLAPYFWGLRVGGGGGCSTLCFYWLSSARRCWGFLCSSVK